MDGDGRLGRSRSPALQTTMVTMYNVVEQASPLLLSLRTPNLKLNTVASQRLEGVKLKMFPQSQKRERGVSAVITRSI